LARAETEAQTSKASQLLQSLKWGLAILLACAFVIVLFAPQPDIAVAPNPQRLQALAQKGELDRPGLVFSAENNYYLFGRALPVAIVSKSPSFWNRFSALFVGRSSTRAIHRLRAVKDETELEKIRRAATITSFAFEAIAPLIRLGESEATIEKRIHQVFREHGATGRAFPCIVGSGANATRPHYRDNNAIMSKGLVVIDIGCSVDNYASDMTRTFPVRGEFTPAERWLVDIVIAAGDSARAHLRPGATMRGLHRLAKEVISEAGFGRYFNHFVGHHVGLNVHDPQIDTLAAGMVITLEPGIYIPAGAPVDSTYWNLGVRIEDTYVVTEDGYEEITNFPRVQ
jgi:Xaa-Pro aminopeptidase